MRQLLTSEKRAGGEAGIFLQGVLALGGGSVAAQLITILAAPILSRLYLPDEFGIYSLFFAIVAPIGVLATARYELAVQLPPRDRDALRLTHLAIALALGTSLLCLAAGLAITVFDGFPGLREGFAPLFLLVAAGVFLSSANQVVGAWVNRIGAFHWRAVSSVTTALTTLGGQIGAGLLRAGAGGLVIFALVGQLAGLLVLLRRGIGGKAATVRVRSAQVRRVAREYSDMPKFSAPAAFLTTMSSSLPVYALVGLFGPNAAGLFALAYRVTYLPVSMLGGAVNQVFFREFTRMRHRGEKGRSLMLRIWAVAAVIALPPVAVLVLAGEPLFAFVFGDKWIAAGKFAGILSIGLFFNFVFGSTNSSAVAMRMQHYSLAFSIANLLVKGLLVALTAALDWDMLTLVAGFVAYDCGEALLMNALILHRLSVTQP